MLEYLIFHSILKDKRDAHILKFMHYQAAYLHLNACFITLINPYKKDSDFGDKAQSNENQKNDFV